MDTYKSSQFGLSYLIRVLYGVIVSLNSAIPVRFSADISARLKVVSRNSGIPLSHLIRIATEQYLEKIETSREVTIPLKTTPKPSGGKLKSNG